MARREYKGAATPTTLTGGITNSATTLSLTDATNWPTGSFSLVIDPGLAGEEKILATSRSGTTVTLTTRGYDNTTASSHTAGAIIYPVPTAVDFDEANAHVNATTGVHGVSGAVVGTTDTQTLSGKTLTSPIVNGGLLNLSLNAQTGTTYTTIVGDSGKLVTLNNASAITLTLPPTTYNIGEQINIAQTGAGQVTFAQGSGVTIRSTGATSTAPKLRVQYSAATVIAIGVSEYLVVGDLS